MNAEHQLCFPPFRLDLVNEQLWRNTQEIPLRQKTFAVLRYLLEHSNQLVTKEAILDAVWAGTAVSDVAPGVCVQELRRALGDDRQTPRFIVTVHRRGYRFIAPLTTQSVRSSESGVRSQNFHPAPRIQYPIPALVGREAELSQLHRWLDKALEGERQIVFVTGEPGIGKTTLIEAFLSAVHSPESAVENRPEENQKAKACPELSRRGKKQKPALSLVEGAKVSNSPPPIPNLWIGRGQCIEHHGAGEAYMPVLEALGRLCREPEGERLIELLGQHAPTWLVQMPALLNNVDLEALQRKVIGATRERMLREMAEALEALTAERPLVLWLEDLHWSDVSTLDLLSVLARRQEQARLLVMGTYRPVEMLGHEHPLRTMTQELQMHRQCEELPLGLLSEAAVAEYLAVRFRTVPSPLVGEGRGEKETAPPTASLRELARAIHQRTDGNPLFMVNVVDYLLAQGLLVEGEGRWELKGEIKDAEVGVPKSIRQMIEKQIERLSPADRWLLEVASVAGAEFSAAAVVAGLETAVGEVEEQCAELTRREQFLRARGTEEWPNGTVAARYGFIHALYQSVLYERVTAAQRINLHRRLAEREEQAYGNRAREIAAELAMHFEQGRDYRKAVQYLQQAGENAALRSAHPEAINHFTKGLELLQTLPDTPERVQQELTLQLALGDALFAVKGYTALEVEQAFARALELCRQVGEMPQLVPVLYRLVVFYFNRWELQTARELAEQMMRLAQSVQDWFLLSVAHTALGWALYQLGELTSVRLHAEQAIALYDPKASSPYRGSFHDPRLECLSYAAWTLWYLGYPDQALKRSDEALALARRQSHPFGLAVALGFATSFYVLRREGKLAREQAEELMTLSTEQGFPYWLAWGTRVRGWALAEQGQVEEGIVQMQQGLAAFRAMGTEAGRTSWLPDLAAAYAKVGQVEEGLAVLAEALALVDKAGRRVGEAELYRVKGELLLNAERGMQNDERKTKEMERATLPIHHSSFIIHRSEEAEACFLKAIEVARRQSAKSLELRAVMSLSRLWQRQDKKKEAPQMLAEIYGWFTEGFDTKDLQEAQALLEELGS